MPTPPADRDYLLPGRTENSIDAVSELQTRSRRAARPLRLLHFAVCLILLGLALYVLGVLMAPPAVSSASAAISSPSTRRLSGIQACR